MCIYNADIFHEKSLQQWGVEPPHPPPPQMPLTVKINCYTGVRLMLNLDLKNSHHYYVWGVGQDIGKNIEPTLTLPSFTVQIH